MSEHIICSKYLNKRCGLVKNIEKELSVSNIHQLELLGYLEKEFSSEGEIWKLSEKGVKLRKLMMKHNSLGEIIKDWIYIHLLKFNIKL